MCYSYAVLGRSFFGLAFKLPPRVNMFAWFRFPIVFSPLGGALCLLVIDIEPNIKYILYGWAKLTSERSLGYHGQKVGSIRRTDHIRSIFEVFKHYIRYPTLFMATVECGCGAPTD